MKFEYHNNNRTTCLEKTWNLKQSYYIKEMDFEHHSQVEAQLLIFIELASDIARGRDENQQKLNQLEGKFQESIRELDRIKRERIEEREANTHKVRKLTEEKAIVLMEVERLKIQKEEIEAKVESYRQQNESLHASLVQFQQQSTSFNSSSNGAQQRLSSLVTKEVIDQVAALHESLKALESRSSTIASNAAKAEARSIETAALAESTIELLKQSQDQLAQVKAAQRESIIKSRSDAIVISALKLDGEGLQEQVNRLREEVASVNQNRRALESELERTKLTIASSIIPILEKVQPIDSLKKEGQSCMELVVQHSPEMKYSAVKHIAHKASSPKIMYQINSDY